jgi:hypothetical protein
MTETSQGLTEACRSIKQGVTDLRCSLERGHDEPQGGQPGTWHESVYTERREVDYPGARHEIKITEIVTWEPVDHAAEATRHLMAGRDAAGRDETQARANAARRAEGTGLERVTVEDALAGDGTATS